MAVTGVASAPSKENLRSPHPLSALELDDLTWVLELELIEELDSDDTLDTLDMELDELETELNDKLEMDESLDMLEIELELELFIDCLHCSLLLSPRKAR